MSLQDLAASFYDQCLKFILRDPGTSPLNRLTGNVLKCQRYRTPRLCPCMPVPCLVRPDCVPNLFQCRRLQAQSYEPGHEAR